MALNKDKIICLVGASGSGKTTIAKELEKLGYNIIHSYTTREPREENEWGHIFIPKLEDMKVNYINHSGMSVLNIEGKEQDGETPYIYYNSNVIAFKEVYEGLYYWATKQQYQNKGISIYVVDPDGAGQVKENAKDAEVVTVYLQCDKETRQLRMLRRKGIESVGEVQERIKKDKEIFKVCKCDYVVDANNDVEEVLQDVVAIITEN